MVRRGMKVELWLASDRWYCRRAASASEAAIRGSGPKLLLQDLVRLVLGMANVLSILFRRAPDLVYERAASMQCMGWVLKVKGSVWIIESNGLFFREASAERKSLVLVSLARRIELACYRWADCVVTVSEALKAQVVKEAGISPEKVVVVRNGVDPQFFGRVRQEDVSSVARVGFVGTLVEWQGVDRLIDALGDERLQGVELHVVGDGPALDYLERLSSTRGIAATFHGRLSAERVPEFMATLSVAFCGHQMSHGENYHSPLKLYEYAACGVPVVSTHSEDAVLLSRSFPIALLNDGWTTTDLADSIQACLDLPRPQPLVVTYDERLSQLLIQLAR